MAHTPSSSNSSSGGVILDPPRVKGKQASPALSWIFTWCNYPEDWHSSIVPQFQDHANIKGFVAGKEICPTTGTPHLQGYLEFRQKARPMGLLPKQVHWRCARGNTNQNFNYCTKDGDYVSWGTVKYTPPYMVNIELKPWQRYIDRIIRQDSDDRTIRWFWEPLGGAGKTTFQKWLFLNREGVMVICGKATDMKNAVIEYEEKHSELPKIVLVNIPRCQDTDHISWQGIEEIKDMFFFSPKYHGGQICGKPPHVLLFSNQEPPMHKLSPDRWQVVRIDTFQESVLDMLA